MRVMTMRRAVGFLIVGTIISVIVMGIGKIYLNSAQELRTNGIQIDALCMGNEQQAEEDGGNFFPIVKFKANNGEEVQATVYFASKPAKYKEGDKVPVIYMTKNPSESVSLNDPFALKTLPWIIIGVGLFMEILIVLIFVLVIKKRLRGDGESKTTDIIQNAVGVDMFKDAS